MKINERTLNRMITEAIEKALKEWDTKGFESEELYSRYGNRNRFNTNGAASMAAQGEYGSDMQNVAMKDSMLGDYNPYDMDGEYKQVDEESL